MQVLYQLSYTPARGGTPILAAAQKQENSRRVDRVGVTSLV